ncbi:GNAT family N-acetyltransferase [Agaribacter marinus]|uniref:N-acetyltransferase domain-containing protein n=1 Tax=Agaribacter marinus TaxID=1431249 RepID=A0AA37WLS9_9ALTE|nr:GNAT family N-acetyltransferase [Agaribacter marinus]GLR72994.1 hypothetical protein GCM10007852_39020 [Agaribacter marinus]
MHIRLAASMDADDIYIWRNDELVRDMSLNSGIVDYESHIEWFSATLKNENRYLFIGEIDGHKVGVCRFDLDGTTLPKQALVSINMNPSFRGRGLAKPMLKKAIEWCQTKDDTYKLVALIKPENKASIQLFSTSGFVLHSRHSDLLEYHYN